MKPALRYACLMALPLALAACKSEKKAPEKGGTAQGEVLPGSASDAMLPYDTVRSQPPLAPPPTDEPKSSGKASKSKGAAEKDAGPGAAPAEDDAPTPKAATPAAKAAD